MPLALDPSLAAVLARKLPAPEAVAALVLSAGGVEVLFSQLDALAARAPLALPPELALELLLAAPLSQVATATRFTEPLGPALLPILTARAALWRASPYRDARQGVLLALALWRAAPSTPFPEEHDTLLTDALRAMGTESESRPVIDALRALLGAIPEGRREALVFGERALDVAGRGHLLWTFAGACPSPRVIQACVDEVLTWKRAEFDRAPSRREVAEECFRLLGTAAAPALSQALLAAGRRAPQRAVLVRALARAPLPSSAAALAPMLDDRALRGVALDGLRALGAEVVARALSEAPVRVQSKVRKMLSELEAPAPPAGMAAVACMPAPTPSAALASLRADITPERDQALWTRLDSAHHDAPEVRARALAEAKRDPTALVMLADRFRAALGRGERQLDGLDLEFFFAACVSIPNPGLADLAAELVLACPDTGPTRLKDALEQAGERLGTSLAQPLARGLAGTRPSARRQVLSWLVEHAPGHAVDAFLAAASDAPAPHRDLAARGLVRAGAMALPQVRKLLDDPASREVAAEVLSALPAKENVAPLASALEAETRPRVRALLEGALSASRLADGKPLSARRLDASLAARAPVAHPLAQDLPALLWTDEKKVSPAAMRGILAALEAEVSTPPSAELQAVRVLLENESCLAFATAVLAAFPPGTEPGWALTQLALFGSEEQVDALGASLDAIVHDRSAAHAAHGVEALKRQGGLASRRWLDHWSRHGTPRLRRDAKEALEALALLRNTEADALADEAWAWAPPRDAQPARAALRERLLIALLTGRTWMPTQFAEVFTQSKLGREAAAGLVFSAVDEAPFVLDGRGKVVSLGTGKAVKPRGPVSLVHPLGHDAAQVATWTEALQKLLEKQQVEPPFVQLRRLGPVPPTEAIDRLLERAELPTRRLLDGLETLGYRRGEVGEAGLVFDAHREVGHFRLTIEHDGFSVTEGRNPLGPTSRLRAVHVRSDDGRALPERLRAEAARDLALLLGA